MPSVQRSAWVVCMGLMVVAPARGADANIVQSGDADDRTVVLTGRAIREVALFKQEPEYPAAARQFRISAEVVAQFTVGLDGKVENVAITKGHPMFNTAVVNAVKRWSFPPFMVDGHARKVKSTLTFDFKL